MLWIETRRPRNFEEALEINPGKSELSLLKIISERKNIPHLLIYGPQGSGKTTLAYCLLQSLFGDGVYKSKSNIEEFTTASNKTIEMSVLSSSYHIDICPGDVRNYDTLVIQELIKSIAKSVSLSSKNDCNFKIILIRAANSLTSNAQDALRRTMEKYIATCRLILITDNLSGISSPLKSRCLCIRNSAPTEDDMFKLINSVINTEDVRGINDTVIKKIVTKANGDMRRALLVLQAIDFQDTTDPAESAFETDWEQTVKALAQMIVYDQKPKLLLDVRDKLYKLLERMISGETILLSLCFEISKLIDDSLKHTLYSNAALFSHRLHHGDKEVIHLEAFVANIMVLLKNYKNNLEFDDSDGFY